MNAESLMHKKKRNCKHGVAKAGKRKGQCLKNKRSKR
jgi:hypothetical protein